MEINFFGGSHSIFFTVSLHNILILYTGEEMCVLIDNMKDDRKDEHDFLRII